MTDSGHGAVTVHRWFSGGEGWACHPWFAGHEREMVAALDGTLRGDVGEFHVPFRGGLLVGEKLSDPFCLDSKAQGRHPFILRAAYLAITEVTDSHRFEALQLLRSLPMPMQPGHLSGLMLRDLAPVELPFSLSRKAIIVTAVGSLMLLVAAILLIVLDQSRDRGASAEPPPNTAKKTTPEALPPVDPTLVPAPPPPSDEFQPDSTGEVPYLNDRTQVEFRRQAGRGSAYDHPYIAFLNFWADRLPEVAPKCANTDEVTAGLRRLLDQIQPGRSASAATSKVLREAIDTEMDYDAWRKSAGQKDYADRHKPLPEELRRHVEKFRHPSPELDAAARRIGELLAQWGDPDAEDPRPLARIDTFFARLTRPTELPRLDHPRVVFLRRLPLEPVAEGQTFDDVDDLARALRHLLYLLDPTYRLEPIPARDLLERIALQMDYSMWRSSRSREHFRDERTVLDPAIERAARRFDR